MRRDQDRNHSPEASKETLSTADLRGQVKQVEADLAGQGVALFPATRNGARARRLWDRIRSQLLRGAAIQITPSVLDLNWHRQELKRAREVLVGMGLIRPRSDGLYVLGQHDPLDEIAREQFLDLKLLEGVLVGLSGLMGKSNTRKSS
jgi:hypothetical protein